MTFVREIVRGTGQLSLAGVSARLLSLVTVPILSRLLAPEAYGVAALAGTVVSLATPISLLGIDMAYARFALQGEQTQRREVAVFCWRFACAGGLATASAVGAGWYWWGSRWLPTEHVGIAIYTVAAILLSVAATMATTRARLAGQYRRLATATVAAALAAAIGSLAIVLLWRSDLWTLLLGGLAASLTMILLLGLPPLSLLCQRCDLSSKQKYDILLLGIAGGITAPMFWVISVSDRWFLARFASQTDLGVYSVASSVALLGLMANSALTLVWFPEASRLYGEHGVDSLASLGRLWQRIVVGLALIWVAVAAGGGDLLRLLTGPSFHAGAEVIPWLAGGVFFYGVAGLANTGFFLRGRMGPVAVVWAVGAAASLCINFILVPTHAALGAAVAQTASFAIIALCNILGSQRTLQISIDWPRIGLCLFLAMAAGVPLSWSWTSSSLLNLFLKAPVFLLMAALVLDIIAHDWVMRGWQSASRRLLQVTR